MRKMSGLAWTAGLIALLLVSMGAGALQSPAAAGDFRVCADPNNLPFSNLAGDGFENKLAELIAGDLNKNLVYVWAPARETFIKDTLNARRCDVVIGVPSGLQEVEATEPYYTSSYTFVFRSDRHLHLSSIKDPKLKDLRIGVHLLGDADVPPMLALARQGIVQNVRGYMIYGDYAAPNPPARLIEAVESEAIDVAAVWGPLAGYFAKHSPVRLEVVPIVDTDDYSPLLFRYDMAIGVRKGDTGLVQKLNGVLNRHRSEIRKLLLSYGIPLFRTQKQGP